MYYASCGAFEKRLYLDAFEIMKQCVQRQQGCLQCCRASCILGVESTAGVVHKSAVATRCASEQKKR